MRERLVALSLSTNGNTVARPATRSTTLTLISNVTQETVVASSAETARSLWKRFIGLMGRASLPPGAALVFPGEQAVHTHFMRFPLDLVFYGRDGTVLKVVEGLRPWRFSPFCFRAAGVIELPAGTIRTSRTQPGDLLVLDAGH